MKPINPDNVFGSDGSGGSWQDANHVLRLPFQNRPKKGKTARKRRFPPNGKKTNIGDPMKGQSIGRKGK